MAAVFALFILLFRAVNSTSMLDAIYILCSYTYGPLLGLFAYALFTRRNVGGKWVLPVCLAAPLLCFVIETLTQQFSTYRFGYELLMLNGALTFIGLWLTGNNEVPNRQKNSKISTPL